MPPSSSKRTRPQEATEALLEVMRLAAPEADGHTLMQSVLDHLRKWVGCEAAGLRLQDGQDFPYYEVRGFPAEFVALERYLCARGPDGAPLLDHTGSPVLDCMCGNVIMGRVDAKQPFFTAGGSFWTNSTTELRDGTTEAERQSRTRNRCNGEGYESVALVPLRVGGQMLGLLQFNDKRRDRFTPEIIAKVEQVAAGIALILSEKQAREALRLGQERYRALFEQTMDGIIISEPDGKIVEANPAACAMFGMTEAELISAPRDDLVVMDQDALDLKAEHDRTGKATGRMRFVRKDGTHFHVGFTSAFLETADGTRRSLLTFRDITEPIRTEESLRDSEARQRDVLAHGGVGVAYWDLDGRIRFLNERALQNLGGGSAEEYLGRSLTEMFGKEAGDLYLVRIREAAASPSPIVYEDRVDLPIGKRWLSSVHTRSLDTAGNVVGVHVYSNDITAHKETEEALRESERDLLEAQKLAHIGNYTFDPANRRFTWSEENYRIWGLQPHQPPSSEDLKGMMAPADLERLSYAAQEAIDHGTPYELELRIRRPDGTERTLIATGIPEFDAAGEMVLLKGTNQDVTERRQVEKDYRTLFREMLDGFALHEIICDDQGEPVDYRFLAVNPAFERMTGLRADRVVGRTVLEALPGTQQHWIATYGRVALTGEPAVFEDYTATLDKHFQVTAFRPAAGQFACIFTDITERKQAEDALRSSEAKLRGIVDNIGLGVTLISPQMEVLEVNPMMRKWFPAVGLSQHPLCYRVFKDHPAEEACDDCPVLQTIQDGQMHEVTRSHTVEGHEFYKRVVSSPILDGTGKIVAVIELVEDVTEKHSLELQLQQAQKMESVGRLAGGVAHDFNNMLGVILGHTEMALDQTDPREPLRASLLEIRKAAERSADLTRQLLAFARKQTITPRVLDMNEVVTGMLNMLERLIGEDIRLEWSPGAGLWPVKVDPSQVTQILTNLCVNSRDAIGGVGRVVISTGNSVLDPTFSVAHAGVTPGEYVHLLVTDDGCGMSKETMARLFEPFFTTKAVGEGSGLGLATVYGIVKQNDGFILAESSPGNGATFTVYLPRYASSIALPEEADLQFSQVCGGETILLVEDEPAVLDLTEQMLERLGYKVIAARTPGEAIRVAREHPGEIHLLVTDVIMPEMNGRDLAKNLLSLYPRMRRLFMSGYTSDVIAHQGVLEEGMNFIQKPFSLMDLAGKARQALDADR